MKYHCNVLGPCGQKPTKILVVIGPDTDTRIAGFSCESHTWASGIDRFAQEPEYRGSHFLEFNLADRKIVFAKQKR